MSKYKKNSNNSITRRQTPNFKMGKDLNRNFIKKAIQSQTHENMLTIMSHQKAN